MANSGRRNLTVHRYIRFRFLKSYPDPNGQEWLASGHAGVRARRFCRMCEERLTGAAPLASQRRHFAE
jgi:hypothetical protein